jgi:hypothetical protein
MSEENQRQVKGIWIPIEIWDHPTLSKTAKILWSEINSLDNEKKGGCFASNEFFMKRLGIKKARLCVLLRELKELNLIEQIAFNGRQRVLKAKISDNGGRLQKTTEGVYKSEPLPLEPYIYENTIESTEENVEKEKSKSVPQKKKKQEIRFGENEQIRLTQEEYEKGKSDYPPGAWDECLQRVDDYIATNKKGSNYRNHNQVIRIWLKRDGVEPIKTLKKSYDMEISDLRKELQKLPIESASYEEEDCIVIRTLAGEWRVKKNSAFESNLKIALMEIREKKL